MSRKSGGGGQRKRDNQLALKWCSFTTNSYSVAKLPQKCVDFLPNRQLHHNFLCSNDIRLQVRLFQWRIPIVEHFPKKKNKKNKKQNKTTKTILQLSGRYEYVYSREDEVRE